MHGRQRARSPDARSCAFLERETRPRRAGARGPSWKSAQTITTRVSNTASTSLNSRAPAHGASLAVPRPRANRVLTHSLARSLTHSLLCPRLHPPTTNLHPQVRACPTPRTHARSGASCDGRGHMRIPVRPCSHVLCESGRESITSRVSVLANSPRALGVSTHARARGRALVHAPACVHVQPQTRMHMRTPTRTHMAHTQRLRARARTHTHTHTHTHTAIELAVATQLSSLTYQQQWKNIGSIYAEFQPPNTMTCDIGRPKP
jgi:hypothetical protein